MTKAKPVVFLDRDGVINERPGAERYVRQWEAFRFKEGALPMLSELFATGYRLVVVTNQQGVGKGLVNPDQLERIHTNMIAEIHRHGAELDGVFCCPHLESEGCDCRKPKPGLIFKALKTLPYTVDLTASWIVGDSPSDIQAGQAAGIRTLLVGALRRDAADPSPTAQTNEIRDVFARISSAMQPQ